MFLCSCGRCNILLTYPTVPPAACRYPLTPLSPHPCRTCSQPEPPEHYPTNTFLSGSTCAETQTIKGCQKWTVRNFSDLLLCHLFWKKRSKRDDRAEDMRTGHDRLHHTHHSIMSYMNHSWQSWKTGSTDPHDRNTYK